MEKKIDRQALHKLLYGMAKEFNDICVRHNIHYFMLGGTMLGAVRHKAIIPWDDDMDFGVSRDGFEKLKKILTVELPSYYQVVDLINADQYASPTLKIEDTRTRVREGDVWRGVFIDIFPLDITNGNKSMFSRNSLIQNLVRIDQYREKMKDRSMLKKIVERCVSCLFWFFPKNYFLNQANKLAKNGKGEYCANHFGFWRMKEIMPLSIFKSRKLYTIGDLKLYGVLDYNQYLESLYGDYMKLPPEDKRHIHLNEMYWKELS